ncbi:hypothetical protein GGD81_000772 [Rhodobium orientis]|uniref:hypothetical protein n=1 Tax=Rhodobium orientis TaxID=34017 RepID=UPI001615BF74|nr:hypothetical protein [Rhodobium orientis]MBB4301755.1 hypothetical protein [Rhodobium orientis]
MEMSAQAAPDINMPADNATPAKSVFFIMNSLAILLRVSEGSRLLPQGALPLAGIVPRFERK